MHLAVTFKETLVRLNGNNYLLSQERSQARVGISKIWTVLNGFLQQHDGFFCFLLGPADSMGRTSFISTSFLLAKIGWFVLDFTV